MCGGEAGTFACDSQANRNVVWPYLSPFSNAITVCGTDGIDESGPAAALLEPAGTAANAQRPPHRHADSRASRSSTSNSVTRDARP